MYYYYLLYICTYILYFTNAVAYTGRGDNEDDLYYARLVFLDFKCNEKLIDLTKIFFLLSTSSK